jgi:small subunit ribosomal protein S6
VLQNEYETVVIIRPDLDDPTTYGLVEKFEQVITGNGGHLLIRDDWGKRKLQYPIAKHLKGHYVVISHIAPPSLVTELERRIRNEDSVIRFLTVQQAEAVDIPTRLEQVAELKRKREEEERLRRERGETEPSDDLEDEDTGEESED